MPCRLDRRLHLIEHESDRAYKDTVAEGRYDTFRDGLTQWWTTAAQGHMTARCFEHRQMRISGSTCAKVAMR